MAEGSAEDDDPETAAAAEKEEDTENISESEGWREGTRRRAGAAAGDVVNAKDDDETGV